jgi:hypothetical protein
MELATQGGNVANPPRFTLMTARNASTLCLRYLSMGKPRYLQIGDLSRCAM